MVSIHCSLSSPVSFYSAGPAGTKIFFDGNSKFQILQTSKKSSKPRKCRPPARPPSPTAPMWTTVSSTSSRRRSSPSKVRLDTACNCSFVCLLACLLVCLLACLLVCSFACLISCLRCHLVHVSLFPLHAHYCPPVFSQVIVSLSILTMLINH